MFGVTAGGAAESTRLVSLPGAERRTQQRGPA
jgi:hypothetical protein